MVMINVTLECRHCQSQNLIRYGLAANGKQRFLCHGCGTRSRENPAPNGYTAEQRETILRAYDERSSLRGLERTFGVSRKSVSVWLKKSSRHCRP